MTWIIYMCKTSTTEERHLISIVVKNYIKSQFWHGERVRTKFTSKIDLSIPTSSIFPCPKCFIIAAHLTNMLRKKTISFFSNEKLEALKYAKKDLLRTWETLKIYQKGSILNLRACCVCVCVCVCLCLCVYVCVCVCVHAYMYVLRSFIPVGVYFASRSSKLDPPPTFSKRRGD